jgi:hypothetical protein
VVPHGGAGFVSHSQSCMLHGDCLLHQADPISVYKDSFRVARRGGQFFGYLDHPFSQRYSYGWRDEAERQRIHAEFLDFMRAECAGSPEPLLFLSEEGCLDFMRAKADTSIVFDRPSEAYSISRTHGAGWLLSVGFRGRVRAAADRTADRSSCHSSHHGR